ncbi:hypothetical protein NHX12_017412, partial [Muraenolepis orangiensis]
EEGGPVPRPLVHSDKRAGGADLAVKCVRLNLPERVRKTRGQRASLSVHTD